MPTYLRITDELTERA